MTPPLTPGQRQALRYASRKGGAHIGPTEDTHDKHVNKPIAKKLITLGYAVQHGDTLLTVKAGHAAMAVPIHIPDTPVYLAAPGRVKYRQLPNGRWAIDERDSGHGDYTTDARQSVDSDRHPNATTHAAVEAISPRDLTQYAQQAARQRAATKATNTTNLDERTPHKRLELLLSNAKDRHVDISNDLRLIRHLLTNGRHQAAINRITIIEARFGLRTAA